MCVCVYVCMCVFACKQVGCGCQGHLPYTRGLVLLVCLSPLFPLSLARDLSLLQELTKSIWVSTAFSAAFYLSRACTLFISRTYSRSLFLDSAWSSLSLSPPSHCLIIYLSLCPLTFPVAFISRPLSRFLLLVTVSFSVCEALDSSWPSCCSHPTVDILANFLISLRPPYFSQIQTNLPVS